MTISVLSVSLYLSRQPAFPRYFSNLVGIIYLGAAEMCQSSLKTIREYKAYDDSVKACDNGSFIT
jgi:hypothetical protein